MHNTFIYRHSELPSFRPEIQAEIVALDVQIADLILKSQGNYRELEELAEVLDNCLDSCQLNLNSIRIVADKANEQCSLKDLPIEQKQFIFDNLFALRIVSSHLMEAVGLSNEELTQILHEAWQEQVQGLPPEIIDQTIVDCLEERTHKPSGFYDLQVKDAQST